MAGAVLFVLAFGLSAWLAHDLSQRHRRLREVGATFEFSARPSVAFPDFADVKRWQRGSAWMREAEEWAQRSRDVPPTGARPNLRWFTSTTVRGVPHSRTVRVTVNVNAATQSEGAGAGSMRIVPAASDMAGPSCSASSV